MKKLLAFACLTSCLSGALPANAEPVRAVIELFTSQSCSSCPPADKLLGELTEKDGVIGIAWHVDYWNYLDWKDTFSSSVATERQYAYAKAFGTNQVYTPQFVVNGKSPAKGAALSSAASGKDDARLPVEVAAIAKGNRLVVTTGAGAGEANLIAVQYDRQETVAVSSGENAGRTIDYKYAVTGAQTVGMWSGKAMQIDLPVKEFVAGSGKGCAILLQRVGADGSPGEIIGAAKVDGI